MPPSEETSPREYRYERKYFVDQLDARQAIVLIKRHPAMFSEIYPARYINNIYLDSPLMDNYHDNLEGTPERRKARVRWYHDLFRQVEQPQLEFKIKKGEMGNKIQYNFPAFGFNQEFNDLLFRSLVRSSDLPLDVRSFLQTVEPVLVNRYRRWYFATPDRQFRVTVDTGLSFYHLNKLNNQFLHHQVDHQSIVIELKYQRENDSLADRISTGFPFRMTRSSKFVQGIERVYL
ncbi:MAG: VTC domain-containing protein [Anaerolineales bacterium]|nr:VTC domain-containing protein [Anaerolineales bacterium]